MIGTSQFRAALLRGTALVLPSLVLPVLALPGQALAQAPNAQPQGGQVVAGSAAISRSPSRTTITQSTDRAAIDWRSFDVGRDQTVQFQQPSSSSLTLNRVTGPDPSQIAGRITANGQVAIVNQSGVVFSQGAQVDVAGLVVSTANISNEAVMAGGKLAFTTPGRPDARIENRGQITVRDAGLAALVAPQVANHGTITARLGRVALAGGEAATVDLQGDGLMSIAVTRPVSRRPANGEALVTNTGSIAAPGGTVVLTAQAVDGVVQDLVRAGGTISADTDAATGRGGRVLVSGTGGSVRIEGAVSATGTAGNTRGGTVEVIGDRTWVAPGAKIDASGPAGGGTVRVGANAQGRAATRLARRTGVAAGATVRADATTRGNGGTVIVNSSEYTAHGGTISAQGGPQGGDGGFVEVSGQKGLDISGTVNVRAGIGGTVGTFLIDPTNLSIVADNDPRVNVSPDTYADGVLSSETPGENAFIAARSVSGFEGNLRLEATNTISVTAGVDKGAGDLSLVSFGGPIGVTAPLVLRGGNLLLQNGFSSAISIDALVQVPTTATITLDGAVTEGAAGRLVGGTLALPQTQFGLSLLGANNLGRINSFTATGAVDIRNAGDLVLGGFNGSNRGALRVTTTGTLTTDGTFSASGSGSSFGGYALVLRSGGSMVVSGAQNSVTANGVRLQAGYDPVLGDTNPASPAGLAIFAQVTSVANNFDSNSVRANADLAAGTGGIQQQGRFSASRLTLRSGGDATFTADGSSGGGSLDLLTLGDSSAAGTLSLEMRAGASSNIGIDGTVRAAEVVFRLPVSGDGLNQQSGSVIEAPTVTLDLNNGAASLTGDNRIGTLTGTALGLDLRNVTNLGVSRFSSTNAAANIQVAGGDLQISDVSSAGDINAQASGAVLASNITSGSFGGLVNLQAGYDFSTQNIGTNAAASLVLSGTIGNPNAPGSIDLGAGSGGITQTSGQIAADNLTYTTRGVASLSGASAGSPNSIGRLYNSSGSLRLDNGTSDLTLGIEGPSIANARFIEIRTAGNISVSPGSDLRATDHISLRASSIGVPSGEVTTTIAAPTVEVAPRDPNAVLVGSFSDDSMPGALALTPDFLDSIQADTLRIGAANLGEINPAAPDSNRPTTASSIRFVSALDFGGDLDLRTTGNVMQAEGADVSAQSLGSNVGGLLSLLNAGNNLPLLRNNTASGSFAVRTAAGLTLDGTQSASTVSLRAGGDITENLTGRVVAGTLAVQSAGNVTLPYDNAVDALTASNVSGALTLSNTSAQLNVPAGSAVLVNGGTQINQTGNLSVAGTIAGNGGALLSSSGDLNVAGRITTSGAVQLLSGGNVALAAGSLVLSLDGSPVRVLAGYDAGTGNTNIASATGLTLAGTIGDIELASPLTLGAGTGGIVQDGGQIVTSDLALLSGGDALLNTATAPNSIGRLLSSQVAGNLLLDNGNAALAITGDVTAAQIGLTTTGDLNINGSLQAASVSLSGGSIAEDTAGRVAAASLSVQAGGDAVLQGNNTVDALSADIGGSLRLSNTSTLLSVPDGSVVRTGGEIELRQNGALRVVGDVSAGSAAAQLISTGDLGVAGSVVAAGEVRLLAGGSITLDGGSTVRSDGGGSLAVLAGYDAETGSSDTAGTAALRLGGLLGTNGSFVDLGAGTGGIVQTGGQLLANNLRLRSGGDVLLDGAATPNSVNALGSAEVAGRLRLDNGVSDLTLGDGEGGVVTAGRLIELRTAGNVEVLPGRTTSATERLSIQAGSISVAGGGATGTGLSAPTVELAPYALANLGVGSSGTQGEMLITPDLVGTIQASTLRLGAAGFGDAAESGSRTTTANNLRFGNSFRFAGTLDLRAVGDITQGAGTTLAAGALASAAGGQVILFNAGNSLPVLLDNAGGSGVSLRSSGDTSIRGLLQSPSVFLIAGNIGQETAGRISATSLGVQSGGNVVLLGPNTVGTLLASNITGSLTLRNTGPLLDVPGGNLVRAGGALEIRQDGNLRVDGTVSGATLLLSSPGYAIQVNGNSAIARSGGIDIVADRFGLAGLLQAAGDVRITAATQANLSGQVAAPALRITAPDTRFNTLDARGSVIELLLGNAGFAGGELDAGGLQVVGGRGTALTGSIDGVGGGPAAERGTRTAVDGTTPPASAPDRAAFLFNGCPIGVANCGNLIDPGNTGDGGNIGDGGIIIGDGGNGIANPSDGGGGPTNPVGGGGNVGDGGSVAPPAIDIPVGSTVADAPLSILQGVDPVLATTAVDRLRPPIPNIVVQIGRDRSEEDTLASPGVRREDY